MHKSESGAEGEEVACKFLQDKGFWVIRRNYRKKWGEIDVIAIKDGITSFFEVKSTTSMDNLHFFDTHSPEEKVNAFKVRQISRMIQTYFAEEGRGQEEEFCFHVLVVFLDIKTRRARVRWLKDIVI